VLDVGANEGFFSALAARCGASVISIDSDPAVVGCIWRLAADRDLDILPLVVDITRPTPSMGWRNRECLSFLDRAQAQFDLVMMLAVIHHMLITERIPLPEILNLAADLSRDCVLIEYVEPGDPMFRSLLRGRDRLYHHLSRDFFEASLAERFVVLESTRIEGLDRWLYLLRKKPART
jgi:hypothetical protein